MNVDDFGNDANGGRMQTVNKQPQANETRNCLDPWYQPFVRMNGDVWPCCWFYNKLGNVNEEAFDQILNGSAFMELRRELLTGNLRQACKECPSRGITTPQALIKSLRASQDSVGR